MPEKKCWLCHRTKKESLDEFKEIVIEKLKTSEESSDREELSRLLQDAHYPFPTNGDSQQCLTFQIAIDDNRHRYVDEDSVGSVYGEVYICPICSSILTGIRVDRYSHNHE